MPVVVAIIAACLGLSVAASPSAASTQRAASLAVTCSRTQLANLLPLDTGSSGPTDDGSGNSGNRALNADDDDDDVLDGADSKEDVKGKRRPDGKAIAAETVRLSVTRVVWLHRHPRPVAATHAVHEHTAARGPPVSRQHTLQPAPGASEVPCLEAIEHARAGCSPTVLARLASHRNPVSATSPSPKSVVQKEPRIVGSSPTRKSRRIGFKLETQTTLPLGSTKPLVDTLQRGVD